MRDLERRFGSVNIRYIHDAPEEMGDLSLREGVPRAAMVVHKFWGYEEELAGFSAVFYGKDYVRMWGKLNYEFVARDGSGSRCLYKVTISDRGRVLGIDKSSYDKPDFRPVDILAWPDSREVFDILKQQEDQTFLRQYTNPMVELLPGEEGYEVVVSNRYGPDEGATQIIISNDTSKIESVKSMK